MCHTRSLNSVRIWSNMWTDVHLFFSLNVLHVLSPFGHITLKLFTYLKNTKQHNSAAGTSNITMCKQDIPTLLLVSSVSDVFYGLLLFSYFQPQSC